MRKIIIFFCLLPITMGFPQTKSLFLFWKSNPEPTLSHYELYKAINDTNQLQLTRIVSAPDTSSWDSTNIESGNLYAYTLRAADSSGNLSDFCDTITVGLPGITWSISSINNADTIYLPLSNIIYDPDHALSELEISFSELNHIFLTINDTMLSISADPFSYSGTASFNIMVKDPLNFYDQKEVQIDIINTIPTSIQLGIPPIFFDEDHYKIIWLDTCVTVSPFLPADLTWDFFELDSILVNYQPNSRMVTFSSLLPNWFGKDTIVIQATAPDQTKAADTTEVFCQSVNDPPSDFNLLLPENGLVFSLPVDSINFLWSSSNDIENDSIIYTLRLFNSNFDTTFGFLADTLFLFNSTGIFEENNDYFWTVSATDGFQTVSSDTFHFLITAATKLNSFSVVTIPKKFVLFQNFPNPFNPTTSIQYGLPKATTVLIELYNPLGQKVKTIYHGLKEAGYHQTQLDASRLNSGIYIYRIQTQNFIASKKLLLIK